MILPIKKMVNDENGAVTMEFAFVLIALLSIIYFTLDIGIYILQKNRLERTNYSLATLVRERDRLYEGERQITQREIDELQAVAVKLLDTSLAQNSKIKVEALYFSDESTETDPIVEQAITLYSKNVSTLSNEACFSNHFPTERLEKNSVWLKNQQRWASVFRVSICFPNNNSAPIFFYQNSADSPTVITASSIAIGR